MSDLTESVAPLDGAAATVTHAGAGGFSAELAEVTVSGDRTLVVRSRVAGPEPGGAAVGTAHLLAPAAMGARTPAVVVRDSRVNPWEANYASVAAS